MSFGHKKSKSGPPASPAEELQKQWSGGQSGVPGYAPGGAAQQRGYAGTAAPGGSYMPRTAGVGASYASAGVPRF